MSILLLSPQFKPTTARRKRFGRRKLRPTIALLVSFVIGLSLGIMAAYQWHNASAASSPNTNPTHETELRKSIATSNELMSQNEHLPAEVRQKLILANQFVLAGKYYDAQTQLELAKKLLHVPGQTTQLAANIPILLYHKIPDDFQNQLDHLSARGYHTVTMQQVGDALRGLSQLPSKPVVLTFDDGYSDGLQSAQILAQRGMRGTYYLIVGGEASHYCIGPERNRSDCGDDYMSWTQIDELSKLGNTEIGVHTIDHADLPTLDPSSQMWQIIAAKNTLEKHIGQKLTTFAYPYGHFSATTVELVKSAGFETAVTTMAGTTQTTGDLFTLKRIRSTLELP